MTEIGIILKHTPEGKEIHKTHSSYALSLKYMNVNKLEQDRRKDIYYTLEQHTLEVSIVL